MLADQPPSAGIRVDADTVVGAKLQCFVSKLFDHGFTLGRLVLISWQAEIGCTDAEKLGCGAVCHFVSFVFSVRTIIDARCCGDISVNKKHGFIEKLPSQAFGSF